MKKSYAHATEVQTLLFEYRYFTVKEAKRWAKSHGFRYGDDRLDEGGPRSEYIRLRQHDPSEYRPGTLRTISLDADETIKAVVGVPLRSVAATRPAGYDSRGPRRNPSPEQGAPKQFVQRKEYERGRTNPFEKYQGVSYYHTAGVYRAHLPDGTTQVFGAKDGGKRGMQDFIDGYLRAPGEARAAKNPRRNGTPPRLVTVPGLGTGTLVARRPGDLVDVRLASGTVVRKPLSALRRA